MPFPFRASIDKRQMRSRQLQGRPFSFKNDVAIDAEETFLFEPEEDDNQAKKYLPFDSVSITNNSDYDVDADINQLGAIIPVPSKNMRTYDLAKVRLVKIINLDTTNALPINSITITFIKDKAGSDELGHRILQRIPSLLDAGGRY